MKFNARLLVTAATGIAAFVLAGAAASAQEDSEQVETVVVSGLRASIENTIALKKASSQVIEAVSMEDIGKLPDQSIAEAIARLPGLAAQRVGGRSQSISIRGLSPDFSTTLLNGREQVSTGDNRSAEYDQYPSELMAGVVVYKTPTADLIGQGLSGTVDMKTIRPLDYDKRVISLNARGETGSLGKLNPDMSNYGYRFSGVYVDQFLDGKLGVTIGLAQMDSPQQFKEYDSWGYSTLSGGALISNGAKFWSKTDNLRRTAAVMTLQYQPNIAFESTLDVYYTKFKDKVMTRGAQLPLYSQISSGVTLVDYQVEDGFVVSGIYSGVKTVVQQATSERTDDLFSVGWKNKYKSGNWVTTLDLNWSSVQRTDRALSSYAGTGRWGEGETDTITFTTDKDNVQMFTTTLDYADYDTILLGGPQNWGGYSASTGNGVHGYQDGYLNYRTVHDYLTNARLSTDVAMEDGFFNLISFGFSYTNRHKGMMPSEYYLSLTDSYNQYLNDGTFVSVAVPEKYRMGTVSQDRFGVGDMLAYDIDGLFRDGYYTLVPNLSAVTSRAGWQVDEMTYAAYVRGDIDTEIGGIPMMGNIGLQIVATHQSSDGTKADSATYASYTIHSGTNYVDFLPSMNLSFNLDDNNVVRLSAARELVRARMDQMSASIAYAFSSELSSSTELVNSPWSGSGGNPKLKPWRANSIDLSYEYYFSRDGYVSLAGFYKNLESYIYQKSTLFDFTGFDTNDITPVLWKGFVTQYSNGKGGDLMGLEFSLSVSGNMFSEWLDGFGLTFNSSVTDSNIVQNPSDPSTPLPGLSKFVTNTTVYYESDGLSLRLNHSYRSKFLGQVTGYDSSLMQNNIKGQGWLDAQISYEFQTGMMKGVSLVFQANNLTDEKLVNYKNNDERQINSWQTYGTQFLFGITYKM